jgi:hypothetical protein
MRLLFPSRSLPSRLVAAALTLLTGLALAAPGHACDKDKSASASTASATGAASCPAMARCPMSGAQGANGATAVTADLKGAHSSSGCCGSPKSTAAVASARMAKSNCPMTAACPPGMCNGAGAATTASSVHRTRPHDAATATRRSAATARTASIKSKPAHKAKAKAKPAAGATAAAVTPGTAGMVAVIDPVTGGVVAATKEQLAAFAASPKSNGGVTTMAARPADPEIVQLPDGTLMARLPERLMMNAVAHRDANGKITFTCGTDPAATAPVQESAAPSTWEVK